MKDCDESVKFNYNPNWPYIPNHPFKFLIIGGSVSGKTNVLLHFSVKNQMVTLFIPTSKIYSNKSLHFQKFELEKFVILKNLVVWIFKLV